MKEANTLKQLKDLLKKPIFTASEARGVGVQPALLSYYVKKGEIERVARGVYKGKAYTGSIDFQHEDLIITAKSISQGVICLISALSIYGLTEEIPRYFWIAIPHSTTAPKRENAKIIRMRDIDIGRIEMEFGGEIISIFDKERTIVDSFRFLGKETAIKALKMALKEHGEKKINLRKLQVYAKKLRVNLDPYILTATT